MVQQGQIAASRMIESLTGWWQLAGVDAAVGDAPVNWLEQDETLQKGEGIAKAPVIPLAPPPVAARQVWPDDIETLKKMIADGAALPGNEFDSRYVAPVGPCTCDIMIISDRVDEDELAAATLGSGASGILLKRMLAAIGIGLDQCYWASLATTMPVAGDLPDDALPILAEFARHQIGIVKPKSLILLGGTTCQALLGAELAQARQSLGIVNHQAGNMSVLTTYHPRNLIARPAMKAQTWKDLQMFAKRADL